MCLYCENPLNDRSWISGPSSVRPGETFSNPGNADPLFYTRRELLELVVVIINAILEEGQRNAST